MGTIDNKDIVDSIIAANGQRYPDERPVVKIVRYSNMFNGGTAYGCIYEGEDLNKYHPSDAIIDPETIWERSP
jgi:hypothetical protein